MRRARKKNKHERARLAWLPAGSALEQHERCEFVCSLLVLLLKRNVHVPNLAFFTTDAKRHGWEQSIAVTPAGKVATATYTRDKLILSPSSGRESPR